jgi:hypothetical protein
VGFKNPDASVPSVNPADIKVVWKIYCDARLRNPGQQVAVAGTESLLPAGTDARSVAAIRLWDDFRI